MNRGYIIELFRKYREYNRYNIFVGDLEEIIEAILNKYKIELAIGIAEAEAKVYAYENIISNSNFKSVLNEDKQKLEQENKELRERIDYLERSVERQEEKAIDNYNDYKGEDNG